MPAYNSAPWIEAAIRSVMNQTFTDRQLIVIDDGSTDDTPLIVNALAEQYSGISLLTTNHLGVANARNVGLEHVKGDFVAFIDSDDLWPPFCLEALYDLMNRSNADIVAGNFVTFDDDSAKIPIPVAHPEQFLDEDNIILFSGEEAVEDSLYQRKILTSLWGKLYKSSLFSGLKTTFGELYEDLDLFYRVTLRASRVAYTPLPVYFYRMRPGSIIHTFTPERLSVLDVTARICNNLSDKYPALIDAAIDRRFSANYDMLRLIAVRLREDDCPHREREIFISRREEIRKILARYSSRELKNNRVRLKNRLGALLFILLPFSVLNYILSLLKKKI